MALQTTFPEYPVQRDHDGKFAAFAWPGGYPVFHVTADQGVLCPKCANDPSNPASTDRNAPSDWRVVASDVNWEDGGLMCDHCNAPIESAYADNDEPELGDLPGFCGSHIDPHDLEVKA